ncbi:conserved hypothetical protein [uncultured Desulfobacterium sp.]|uniref:ATPase dynein-related AAA domain-containing protein n=1 Tax=uncultured Desulfobacterium sp. TaxID=201089 RepID=A0A445MT82_9BACT|nr:conserved hypothetical protein [uncultured Desulfobacterium sp.]
MAQYYYDERRGTVRMNRSLDNLYDFFEEKGFFFPKEILTRYFLSLKTKPFVILTGISGTGKTKIAQLFAEYMLQDFSPEEKENGIAFISVRPDWMDNKGLLGFYNLLDEKYHATRLLELLLRANEQEDRPFFVIFDEMNLAKVEYYFSDFLSIMETRTRDNPKGEPLRLHNLEKAQTPSGQEILRSFPIPPNVFFSGTVNVDESTYMFSPKVLDRANVIEFNEVDIEGYEQNLTPESRFYMANDDVRKNLLSQENDWFASKLDYEKFREILGARPNPLKRLLDLLKEYNLHFGYRVVNEISRFISNAHQLIEPFDLNDAIDVQILQKVLPKLHGTKAVLEKPLQALRSFCNKPDALPSDEHRSVDDADVTKAVFYRSARKVKRMLQNLQRQGFTSFIE